MVHINPRSSARACQVPVVVEAHKIPHTFLLKWLIPCEMPDEESKDCAPRKWGGGGDDGTQGRKNAELSLKRLVGKPKASNLWLHCTRRTRSNAGVWFFGFRIQMCSTGPAETKAACLRCSRRTLGNAERRHLVFGSWIRTRSTSAVETRAAFVPTALVERVKTRNACVWHLALAFERVRWVQ